MTQPELKPCPFCGGDAVYLHENNNAMLAFIACQQCGARGHRERQDDRAARFSWNRRVPTISPEDLAAIKKVRDEIELNRWRYGSKTTMPSWAAALSALVDKWEKGGQPNITRCGRPARSEETMNRPHA